MKLAHPNIRATQPRANCALTFLVLYRTCTDKLRFQMSFETACHAEDALAVTIMYTGLSVVNTLTCVSQHPTTNQLFPGSAVDCTDRPMLLNITCDCSGCLSVSSTTCSASCFMWFEESGGHSRLVLIKNIAADSSGYLLLSDLTQQTCHGNYSPSQDELMCCENSVGECNSMPTILYR